MEPKTKRDYFNWLLESYLDAVGEKEPENLKAKQQLLVDGKAMANCIKLWIQTRIMPFSLSK